MATIPASLATGAQAALPTWGSGASEGTWPSSAQVQPRLISAPSSQWAILATSGTINTARQPAILGSRSQNVSLADDTIFVPSMTNGGFNSAGNSQPRVTVLSPDLSAASVVTIATNNNTVLPWTASQQDDTIWLATDDGSVHSYLVSVNGRTLQTSAEQRIQAYASTPIREFQGMVAVDDTLYVSSQIGTATPQRAGFSSVPTASPTSGALIPSSYTDPLKGSQVARSVLDDTIFTAGQVLYPDTNNCRTLLGTSPSLGTTDRSPLPWCSRGAAGGHDRIYVGQGPAIWDSYSVGAVGNGIASINPKNVDDSTITAIPGGGQFWGMAAWPNPALDDTVFVADQSKDAVWVLKGGTTPTADDSVVFDRNCGTCTPYYVTAARPDLVYATVYEAGWDARVSAVGVVSGQTVPNSSATPLAGMQDDSITINLTLPTLFTQNAALVEKVLLDDSETNAAALVRSGNTIQAKVPAGTGGPYSVLVELNGGNQIKVGEFTYGATVTFDANGGSGAMNPQTSTTAASLTANAFTRNGYNFTGWNTAANGSGTAYADQQSYNFSSNLTLYAQWTVIPPRPPRPIPTPTPSPSPTPTPDPTPTPVPVPAPLEPGESELTINGVPRPVTVSPNAGENRLNVQGDGWTMDLDGLGPSGTPLNLGPNGVLRVQVGRDVQTEGTGFRPDSAVGLFLNPPIEAGTQVTRATWFGTLVARVGSGTSIGTVKVDAQGSFLGTATLPRDIKPGTHVLQAVGFGPSGDTRALSLGVLVEPSLVLDQGVRIKGKGRIHDRINTTGSSTGIDEGTRLTPYIRYTGQRNFTKGKATIVVAADGTFRWTRQIRRDKGVTGYVAYRDLASNQVTWVKLS